MSEAVTRLLATTVGLLVIVGAPFFGVLFYETRSPNFQAWAIVWCLLAIPAAGLLFGQTVDRRAEFAENALREHKLDADAYVHALEVHHAAKRQHLVLSAIAALVPAGLFMALLFPATELIELDAALGTNNLTINTKNAGFALMALASFGLCAIGLIEAFFKPKLKRSR